MGPMGKKSKKITIVDIAEKANVSVTTVSRVINDSELVGRKTRNKVLKVINELNYIPNKMAQSFAKQRSKTIALIIPDISNPFFADIVHGVEDIVNEHGYSMFLCNSNFDHEKETAYLKEMAERRVDGVIIISAFLQNVGLIQFLHKNAMRIVAIQSQIEGIDCVNTDDYDGMYEAINHLISLGHKKIGFICVDIRGCCNRFQAYKDALEHNNIPFNPQYVCENKSHFTTRENIGYLLTKELLSLNDPPTAIQTLNDYLAFGAYMAVSEMGLTIPHDISIIGYDDLVLSKLLNPPLTTVSQPAYAMGKAAGELLLKNINEGLSEIHKEIRLPTRLIIRESTSPPLN